MKTRSAKRKPRTYFEQVPVKVVKKIAVEKGPEKRTTKTKNIAEPAATKTEPYSVPLTALSWTGR